MLHGSNGSAPLSSQSQQYQLVQYSQPVQDIAFQQHVSNQNDSQAQLQAYLQYLSQKQYETQQLYSQLGQNMQNTLQQNFHQFGNKFFEHQNNVLGNQQQQQLSLQQDYLRQQMQTYAQQQQQIQQQLQQQYDTHGNKLLEYQQQNNQQLAQNLSSQNAQFQTQQAQYSQQVSYQYQQHLASFKSYLENLLQTNTDTIFNKFQDFYRSTSTVLENQLEDIKRDLALSSANEVNAVQKLQSQQLSLTSIIDNLKHISTFVQKDLSLLCKTQTDLFNTSIDGNSISNQHQCDILNYCFKQITSKIDSLSDQRIDSIAHDTTQVSKYMQSLKAATKDIQRCVNATVESIVLQRFDKFETQFNQKVDDLSKALTMSDQKINSQLLQQSIPKRPSTSSITKQEFDISPNFISQGQTGASSMFQPQIPSLSFNTAQYPNTSSITYPIYNTPTSSPIPSSRVNAPLLPQLTAQLNPLPSYSLPPCSTQGQPSSISQLQVPYPIPSPPQPPPQPPPTLPYMIQQPSAIPSSSQQLSFPQGISSLQHPSPCVDPFCQNPSCITLLRKHDHIPMYNGSSPLNYWLRRVDREVQSCGYTDHQAFLLAQSRLDGDALFWLDQNDPKFLTYQHPTISSYNKYSYQLLKPQLSKKFTKSFEDFFEDLDKLRQRPNQTYKQFMRKLQVESQHGSISMRYLKQVFVRNIINRQVALHLSHHINDDLIDLQQLASKAITIERELNRSRPLSRSLRSPKHRPSSPFGSRSSFRSFSSRRSSRPSRSASPSSYYIPSRSPSPVSRRSPSPSSSTSSKYNPRFKRYKSPSDRTLSASKDTSQRGRKVQHVSLSSATRPSKLTVNTQTQQTPSFVPLVDQQDFTGTSQQTSNMVQNSKQQTTSNKDVTNYSIRETLNNLKVQISFPTLLHNSKAHLQSFYDFVSDLEKPSVNQSNTPPSTQQVQHVISGTKTRITAARVDTMKYLNVFINNHSIQAVLDGGSQPSLVNVSLCKQLGYTSFRSCNTNYSMIYQSTFKPLGILSIPIQLSDTLEVLLELVVVQECGFQLLLGLDFINSTQLIQYPTKVQVKNPSTKRYMDLPLIEQVLGTQQRNYIDDCYHPLKRMPPYFQAIYKQQQSSTYTNVAFSITRVKSKHLRKTKAPTIKQVRIPKSHRVSSRKLQHILYPNFPTCKYNLILCDAPWTYSHVNALTPQYRTLSYSQLKALPIQQIAARDSVFLYQTTGPMLPKSLQLCKSYGFKHHTVFHVWRKLRFDNQTYYSRTNTATLTQPNMEFLIVAFCGNYKRLLNKNIPNISQDLPTNILPHSQKPKQVYSFIAKIFNVFSFPCIELFARQSTHQYFDLYGDQIPNYFQPSQKVLSSKTHFSSTKGCVMSVAQLPTIVNADVTSLLTHFTPSLHPKLSILLKDTPFKGSQLLQCMRLLSKFLHIFAWSTAVGRMTNIKHEIRLLPNAQPKAFVPYRLSQEDRLFVEKEINELLRLGYIIRCASPWAAPVIVVPKEGGKRMVIDFRYLNSQTVKEHWPLPNFQDFLSYLPNARYVSKIDLKSGFFNQLYKSSKDEDLTNFVCHLGQFKTTRLWFGLCNAPSSFQRAIMDALGPLVFKCALVYIDDILIFSDSFDQHLTDLTNVLTALEKANVKLHPTKCSLFNTKTDFLGHTIFDGKITPKLKRYSLLDNMHAPKNKTQIKCFLGLISYYRRFISNFSSVAKPLTDLLQKDVAFTWTQTQQHAFDSLRTSLLHLPTLHLPIASRTFVLNTNFSCKGIGAVLQQQDSSGKLYPIEFISRTLNKFEQKYGSYEGETLAVIFALSRFRHYLMGQHFILQTDNHALQQVLKNKSNSPKIHRWLLQLSEFNFTVIHKKGSENSHADALSRLAPLNTNISQVSFVKKRSKQVYFRLKPLIRYFNPSTVPNLHKRYIRQSRQLFLNTQKLKSILRRTSSSFQVVYATTTQLELPYQPIDLPDIPCESCNSVDKPSEMYLCEFCGKGFHSFCFPPCPIIVPKEFYYCNNCISKIQRIRNKDPILDFQLLNYVKTKKFSSTMSSAQRDRILQRCSKYSYSKGFFYIRVKDSFRILPTTVARQQILFEFHDNVSHPGQYKTLSLIMHKYFWPSLCRDVHNHIKHCSLCICKRAEYRNSTSLLPLPKGNRPFQIWHVDLLTDLPPTQEDFKHILVCICSFSKWVELVPLKNRSALEIAHAFYRDIVCRYGSPLIVICDNGGEFQAEFTTLLHYINCHQQYINPNRPRVNGQAERFVQTTTNLLRSTLHSNNIQLNNWVTSLPTVLYTLRMSNSVHPVSPFQIIHGFIPNLISPINTTVPLKDFDPSDRDLQNYVTMLADFQHNAFTKTAQRLQQQFDKGNYYYKKKSTKFPYSFKVNDLVFKSAGRTSKLQLHSEGPFIITSFKNPTTVILQDTSNNSKLQSSIYNLIPIPVLKNNNDVYEPQPIAIHKRATNSNKRNSNKRQQ